MIYRKERAYSTMPGGFFRIEEEGGRTCLHGSGFGEHIGLRDDSGNQWRGSAERSADDTVRYTFRDPGGRTITGVASGCGLVLRDKRGKTWRGFVD